MDLNIIDLRSDTVTRPTPAMRQAMAEAEVGDDVYGDDPTVNALEAFAADLLDLEAAVFAPSGTQTNLMALLAHCERGDEYIVGQQAHTYKYEGGGAAVLGSIQPQPLEFEADGSLDLDRVAAAIKPDDPHFTRTRLLCLENTHHGRALPVAYFAEAREFVDQHGLGLHLDGARVFNAAVFDEIPVADITRHFDTVSVCLSKGLGAPVGSLLVGRRDLIEKARRWRKVLGGGMRQAGILAAGGRYALENHVERLADDHANARRLAKALSAVDSLTVDYGPRQTNMVYVTPTRHDPEALAAALLQQGVQVSPSNTLRLVMHLDIASDAVDTIADAFIEALKD